MIERAVDGVIVIGVEETFTLEYEVEVAMEVARIVTGPLGTVGGAVYVAVPPLTVW